MCICMNAALPTVARLQVVILLCGMYQCLGSRFPLEVERLGKYFALPLIAYILYLLS